MIAQTCRDYELILVDDGSTDHSAAMCDQLARQHHCRVIHQKNGGLGAARNTGIEAAQGDYLFFLDSDDFISPDTLQGLSAEMDQVPADIYTFGFVTSDGTRDIAPFVDQLPYHQPLTLHSHPELLLALPNAWWPCGFAGRCFLRRTFVFPPGYGTRIFAPRQSSPLWRKP